MAKIYTTNDVLKIVKISRTTLYNWLSKGKVPDVKRDRNNFRVFTDSDIKRIISYRDLIKEPQIQLKTKK